MPRVITDKIRKALEKAWLAGSISLTSICPNCFKRMDMMDHGKCSHCKKGCGCSFNPVSSSDFCDFHRRG
jgi:hypothetical protein